MHPTIKYQKTMMQHALKVINEMETVKSLIKPIDNVNAKVITNDLRNDYMSTMEQLFNNLLQISINGK